MNRALISRCFNWKQIICTRLKQYEFTVDDYKKSVDLAVSHLPKELKIKEIVLESEIVRAGKKYKELRTIIYWN